VRLAVSAGPQPSSVAAPGERARAMCMTMNQVADAPDSASGIPWLRRPNLLGHRPENRQAYSEGFRSGIGASHASASSRNADCQFRVTTSCA